jgi:hypothetical protein
MPPFVGNGRLYLFGLPRMAGQVVVDHVL